MLAIPYLYRKHFLAAFSNMQIDHTSKRMRSPEPPEIEEPQPSGSNAAHPLALGSTGDFQATMLYNLLAIRKHEMKYIK